MLTSLFCAACGRPISSVGSLPCPGCRCLQYCSEKHLRLHQQHAHQPEECQRMAEQLQRGPALMDHGMPWKVQDMDRLKAWVDNLCCKSGMVQFCLHQHLHSQQQQQQQQQAASVPQQQQEGCGAEAQLAAALVGTPPALRTSQQQWQHAWGLQDPAMLPPWRSTQGFTQGQPVADWRQYYDMRQGIDHRSPAALVLHPVLTLWHCLVSILPSHGWQLPPPGDTIRVAYLGPKQELYLLPAFLELALLLPHHQLDIHMIGPDIPDALHAKACAVDLNGVQGSTDMHTGSLEVSCWAACFHDVLEDWTQQQQGEGHTQHAAVAEAASTPGWGPAAAPSDVQAFHLVFAANAGLPAFPSWLPTLQRLAAMAPKQHQQQECPEAELTQDPSHSPLRRPCSGVPVLFSDYCEEAVHMSQQLVQDALHEAFTLGCFRNPFRDPVPATAHGTLLPACSNGFLFGWL